MPTEYDGAKALDNPGSREQLNNSSQDLLDIEDITDYDDDYDEEAEYAYQCDFQKKRPDKACSKTSLLSNLLLTAEQCNSTAVKLMPIDIQRTSTNVPTDTILSESLKKNLERAHSLDSRRLRRSSNQDISWTDNFSKW